MSENQHEPDQFEAPMSAGASENQGWSCTACTFSNPEDVDVCQLCYTKKELMWPSWSSHMTTDEYPNQEGQMVSDSLFGVGMGAILGGGLSLLRGRGALEGALHGAAVGGMAASFFGPALREMAVQQANDTQLQEIQRSMLIEGFPMDGDLLEHFSGLEGHTEIDGMDYEQLLGVFGGPEQRPASSEEVNSLPILTITPKMMDDETQKNQNCQVCLEGYEVGQKLKMLPCFHRFHAACIDEWLRVSGCCPVCKHNIQSQPQSPG